jgi:hypothetical protein
MDAAYDLHGRGVPRLLRHFAAFERLTDDLDGPSVSVRLEKELGCDLAEFLVAALARPSAGGCPPLSLCA